MQQNGLPSADKAAPPFATRDGLPTAQTGGAGSHVPQDRPQTTGKPEVAPSPGEIPSGGKTLLADPTGKAGNSGTVTGVNGVIPWKNLK